MYLSRNVDMYNGYYWKFCTYNVVGEKSVEIDKQLSKIIAASEVERLKNTN